MKQGTSTGVLDEFLATICVGDEIVDKAGTHYTVDRFGRAKPTSGGNELPLKTLEGVTICKSWAGGVVTTTKTAEAVKPVPPENVPPIPSRGKDKPKLKIFKNPETEAVEQIRAGVKDAGDQTLVDELRKRGWTVTCTKVVEKIVFEEVTL